MSYLFILLLDYYYYILGLELSDYFVNYTEVLICSDQKLMHYVYQINLLSLVEWKKALEPLRSFPTLLFAKSCSLFINIVVGYACCC